MQIEMLKQSQNPDQKELVKQLQAELEKLKKIPDQRQLVAELQKQIEMLKVSQNPDQKELVKQLQVELDKLKKIPDQRQMVAEMQKQIEALIKQNQELSKREIASVEKKFMMISAIWSTEKHDVDLVVVDPDGFKYNFKQKGSPKSIGNFEIDSRYGPGLELWKSEDLKPGKYQVNVSLYNQYGNTKDTEVKINIVTNKKSTYLKPAILNLARKDQKYEFTVDEKGNISE
jgi:ATP-dependent 26S proteasome regulatory subunit